MSIVAGVLNYFWSKIMKSSTSRLQQVAQVGGVFVKGRQSEVTYFNFIIMVDQNVFRFKVAMSNFFKLTILQRSYDLSEVNLHLAFRNIAVFPF